MRKHIGSFWMTCQSQKCLFLELFQVGLIQPSHFQPTVFLLEIFFLFFRALNAVLSAWQVWMHLMHFGVVNNNNSNKTEGRPRSFDLAAAIAFWWKPWQLDLAWSFQGSLPLGVGVTGRHLVQDAGASTSSTPSIPETRRGLEWKVLLLALALLLNYTSKHVVKSFSTELYNAASGGLTPRAPHLLEWASLGKPTPSGDHGRICTASCKRLSGPQLRTHPPIPPRDSQVSTCRSQPGGAGGVGDHPPRGQR